MPNPATPNQPAESGPEPGDETESTATPYAEALTNQTRIDYHASKDGSSAGDEIKLSRAMTIRALRARKYAEARAWQQTLSAALRIQAKAEGLQAGRDDAMTVLLHAAHDSLTALSTSSENPTASDVDGDPSTPAPITSQPLQPQHPRKEEN